MASPNMPLRFEHIPIIVQAINNFTPGCDSFKRVNGVYTNVADYFTARRDGRIFTIKKPLYSYSTVTTCIKADANAGMVCKPSTNTVTGQDDYRTINAFFNKDCNFTVDDSGVISVTAIEGDEWFKRDGSNGDVGVFTPTLYWRISIEGSYIVTSISDTKHEGFSVQPGGKYPDESTRPFVVYAKYTGVKYNGKLASVSGLPTWNRTISQNTLIDARTAKGAGYSGKTSADDWYVKVMFMMKYGNASSQTVFAGCTSYNYQYNPAVAETGVKRVILTNEQAANLIVGSRMMLGTHTSTLTDRYYSDNYDVFDNLQITKIETYDSSNKAVYFDTDTTFNTETTYLLSTAPWGSGSCDNVLGRDGSPTSCTNGKEPFIIQGIECMNGVYEVIGNIILNAQTDDAGNLYEDVYICYNSANYSKSSITSNYVNTGVSLPIATVDGWSYAKDFTNAGGLLAPQGYGATSTTGIGDGVYQNVRSSKGLRDYMSFGLLDGGGHFAGLFSVYGRGGLSDTDWAIASRLSALGLSAA